jgi:hypothetical protein
LQSLIRIIKSRYRSTKYRPSACSLASKLDKITSHESWHKHLPMILEIAAIDLHKLVPHWNVNIHKNTLKTFDITSSHIHMVCVCVCV